MNTGLFITGTDTGIGKTLTSTLLLSALQQNHINSTYFKPVQTGTDDDTTTVSALTGTNFSGPVYKYPQGISPHLAASINKDEIDLSRIESKFNCLKENNFVITEGAGGLLVPLNPRENMRSLALKLKLPVLLVSSTRLGTINHTLLTLEAARSHHLHVVGIILSGPLHEGLHETLEKWGKIKVLTSILPFEVKKENVKGMALEYFPKNILEIILGEPL